MADNNREIRSYEISIWTLQDRFLSVLKWANLDCKGQLQDPEMILRDDGTQELTFSIPQYYYIGPNRIDNPMWLHLESQPLEANMHKLKVIFNKGTEDEDIFEMLVVSVEHEHSQDVVSLNIKAEGLAFHELGKIGYKIALSQENFEIKEEKWVKAGMDEETRPKMNIQYWNDLVFKDQDGNWRTNWRYEIQMDWSSYSSASIHGEKRSDIVYEDEYVSSWQLSDGGTLLPRQTEGYKEKWRPVDISESNIYNITQTIAEQFGVFCRYEYEHNENYEIAQPEYEIINSKVVTIPTRKVIYYNNYYQDQQGHIDLTYPYSSSAISRTVDSSNITTKMFIRSVDNNSETITIMDVDANKSKEDYLMNFDYLHDVQAVTDEQYDEISNYETDMFNINNIIIKDQERIRILTNQLIDAEAELTTYTNSMKEDDDQWKNALKLKAELTGGTGWLDINTHCTVMVDTDNGIGEYIKLQYEGLDPTSIRLWENNTYRGFNQNYSNEITSYEIETDEYGNPTRLTHLSRKDTTNISVWITGRYNPSSYYDKIADTWSARLKEDTIGYNKALEKVVEYNWYIHGSRVDYAVVDGMKIDSDEDYPVGCVGRWGGPREGETDYDINNDVPIYGADTESKSWSEKVGVCRILANDSEWNGPNPTYDYFFDIDSEKSSPDLEYDLEFRLKVKEDLISAFERMMGPALREGYWQPDNYHDYGDIYKDSFVLYPSPRENEEEGVTSTPYLHFLWDYENYYEDETPLLYESSVSGEKNQHLLIDLTGKMDLLKYHLNDLSYVYCNPAHVGLIYQTHEELNEQREIIQNFDLNNFITSIEGLNVLQLSDSKDSDIDTIKELYSDRKNYASSLINSITNYKNPENIDQSPFIEDQEDYRLNCMTKYLQEIIEYLGKIIGLTDDLIRRMTGIDKYKEALTVVTNEKNSFSSFKEAIEQEGAFWNFVEARIVYDTKKNLPNILESSMYRTYTLGADCELGWIITREIVYKYTFSYVDSNNKPHSDQYDTLEEFNQHHNGQTPIITIGGYKDGPRKPVLIITGAKELDDDSIRYLVSNTYLRTYMENGETKKQYISYNNEKYKPYLGIYKKEFIMEDSANNTEGRKGTINLIQEKFYTIQPEDYIGIPYTIKNTDITLNDCRSVPQKDYDNIGISRYPTDKEYQYCRVYPRLFFETLKLKNNSSDLYINLNSKPLSNIEDYSTVMDDRSIGKRTYGVGQYSTLKADELFALGTSVAKIDVIYTLSNVDVSIYLDALKIMKENSKPKVSYNVELNILNSNFIRTAYKQLNRIVYINDNDLKLDDVSGYISSVTMKLDRFWEDTVEIKNYETKFEDLFSTIVAQTEAMKKSSGGLDTAVQAFTSNGLIDPEVLQNSALGANLNLSFNQGKLTIDQENGIWGVSEAGVVAFRGGGIFTATQRDANGSYIWNTGILPSGINASLITSGQLDTNKIKVYAGDQVRFQLNGRGLIAYKEIEYNMPATFLIGDRQVLIDETTGLDADTKTALDITDNLVDSKQYVIFHEDGLALVAKAGTWHPTKVISSDKGDNTTYEATTQEIKRVEVSWDGLKLRNWNNEEVFYADPNTGDLTLNGKIISKAGEIGGWTIGESELLSNSGKLILQAGSATTSPSIFLSTQSMIAPRTINGQQYYCYSNSNSTEEYYSTILRLESDVLSSSFPKLYHFVDKEAFITPKYTYGELQANTSMTEGIVNPGQLTPDGEVTGVNSTTAINQTEMIIYILSKETAEGEEPSYLKYNDESITYDNDTSPTSEWYTKIKAAYPNNYREYVNIVTASQLEEVVLDPEHAFRLFLQGQSDQPPFRIAADDTNRAVSILSGKIGDVTITPNGLNGEWDETKQSYTYGHISNSILSGIKVSNGKDEEAKELASCFCEMSMDNSTGEITLTRLDGTHVNFNIAAMEYFKKAIAAAGQLKLELKVENGIATATAKTSIAQVTQSIKVSGSSGGGGGDYQCDGCSGQCRDDCSSQCSSWCHAGCGGSCQSMCRGLSRQNVIN